MTTQYSPILKLALPVQGELSGTWGDVVNDNITSMVEQAIAGRAVIDTWTTDSHTLTSANGTTSESRCAMLELTDTGTALTGAGTVICPTASKIYIVKNATGQNITVQTSGGTGILVPNGRTTFLFCDGTNVVEAMTHTTSLQLGTSTTVTAVLDEDNMASDSATSLATQQSIKAYVDAQVGANNELSEVLANGNTSGANDIIVDSGQKITTNTIDETTAGSGVTIDSVLLKDDVVNATDVETGSISANDGTTAATIADSTGVVTVPSAVLTTADINGGTADGVVIGGTTPAAATATTVTANTSLTIAGTVTVTSILDEDNMSSDDPAGLATQQSIKAYVDAQVGTVDTWSEVLANGNTSGATDAVITAGQKITTDTIDETTADAGVTVDGVLLKDDVVNATDIETSTISANDGTTAINIADSTGAVDIDTSLNVDGAITSDGLTVDSGATSVTATIASLGNGVTDTASIDIYRTNAGHNTVEIVDKRVADLDGGNLVIRTSDTLGTVRDRMLVSENGDISFYDTDGTTASFVYDADAGTTFNDNQDARDFTVKSDGNASMLYVDGTNDRVGINEGTPTDAKLHVDAGASGDDAARFETGAAGGLAYVRTNNVDNGSSHYTIVYENEDTAIAQITTRNRSGSTASSGDIAYELQHTLTNASSYFGWFIGGAEYLSLTGSGTDFNSNNGTNKLFITRTSGTQDQSGSFYTDDALFVLDSTQDEAGLSNGGFLFRSTNATNSEQQLAEFTQAGITFNRSQLADTDFAVRSANDAHMLFVDASEDKVGIRDSTPQSSLSIKGQAGFETITLNTTSTSTAVMFNLSTTNFGAAKYLVSAHDTVTGDRYVTEILVTHDGTTAVATEYGQVGTNGALATYDVDIYSGNVRLLTTPASSNSTNYRLVSTQLLA